MYHPHVYPEDFKYPEVEPTLEKPLHAELQRRIEVTYIYSFDFTEELWEKLKEKYKIRLEHLDDVENYLPKDLPFHFVYNCYMNSGYCWERYLDHPWVNYEHWRDKGSSYDVDYYTDEPIHNMWEAGNATFRGELNKVIDTLLNLELDGFMKGQSSIVPWEKLVCEHEDKHKVTKVNIPRSQEVHYYH